MHYSCKSCLKRSCFLVLHQRRRLDTFTFQKTYLSPHQPVLAPASLAQHCQSPNQSSCGSLSQKLQQECLSMQLHFKIYSFFFFTFLPFLKRKTLALSADPEERNCFIKEDIHLAWEKKCLGKGSIENLDVEVAGLSVRRHVESLPLFLFLNLIKSLRFMLSQGG